MAEGLSKEVLKDLIALGAKNAEVSLGVGNTPFIVIPNDFKAVPLADYVVNDRCATPLRIKGTAKVSDVHGFSEYYTLFHDDFSRVFADEDKATILAVLDHHQGGSLPRWGSHRLELAFRPSKEWTDWKAQDGKKTPQMDFAEFIEDHAPDIVDPSAATMLEVARDLSAKTDVDFGSAIRMSNGSVQFKYSEQVKGSFGAGNLEVPERFVISIPVYLGCDPVPITARLRYRINSGRLSFWFDLLRADAIKREAFQNSLDAVEAGLAITIINGVPA